jgi:hypothetical protein
MDGQHEVLRCAVCGSVKDARKRRGYKRVLCRLCAEVALDNERHTRAASGWPRFDTRPVHKPQDGGVDTYEGKLREYEE